MVPEPSLYASSNGLKIPHYQYWTQSKADATFSSANQTLHSLIGFECTNQTNNKNQLVYGANYYAFGNISRWNILLNINERI